MQHFVPFVLCLQLQSFCEILPWILVAVVSPLRPYGYLTPSLRCSCRAVSLRVALANCQYNHLLAHQATLVHQQLTTPLCNTATLLSFSLAD
jgi:hypothetical protein